MQRCSVCAPLSSNRHNILKLSWWRCESATNRGNTPEELHSLTLTPYFKASKHFSKHPCSMALTENKHNSNVIWHALKTLITFPIMKSIPSRHLDMLPNTDVPGTFYVRPKGTFALGSVMLNLEGHRSRVTNIQRTSPSGVCEMSSSNIWKGYYVQIKLIWMWFGRLWDALNLHFLECPYNALQTSFMDNPSFLRITSQISI